MSFSKFVLLFVSLLLASTLYADIKDEAQAKASKIADVEAELNRANADASAAKDQKWKSCVSGHLGAVKNLVSSASGIVAKITAMVAAGKISEAQGQLVILNGMAESADKSLAAAQSCERSAQTQTAKTEQQNLASTRGTVSSALSLNMGNEMPTEINRGAMEGSDSADAGGVDASGVIQTSNDGSAATDVTAAVPVETPEDAAQVEQIPDQEDQSPTM